MRMLILVVGFCAQLAFGAITGLRVVGVTNTQAVIAYTAPTTAACTVQISETEDFATVVNDVNTTLFPDSNLDSRDGSVSNGRERIFVAGNRWFDEASDGERYSRALKTVTLHWARPNCGGDTATISFVTASVPFGLTRPDPVYTVMPTSTTGQVWFPTRSLTDRAAYIIDPHTGVMVKNMALPGDWSRGVITNAVFNSVDASTNWTNASNVLASGGGTADYDGADCAGPTDCDWLVLTTGVGFDANDQVDYLNIPLTGLASDATAANREVDVCFWASGACTPNGPVKTVTLGTSSGSVTAGTTNAGDNFFYSWYGIYSTGMWNSNGGLKIGIRKKTNVGTISLDLAAIGTGYSTYTRTGSGGNTERCQTVADGSGYYFCTGYNDNALPTVYKVHGDTGEVKYLGVLPTVSIPGYGGEGCSDEYQSWSRSTVGLLYCSKHDYIFKWQYTGDGTNKAIRYASSAADWSISYLPNGTNTTSELVAAFVSANSSHYPIAFTAGWSCAAVEAKENDNLAVKCTAGSQNAVGWEAFFNSSGTVIAARYSSAHPSSRWCGIHSYEVTGAQPISMWNTKALEENANGGGPYTTTLTAAITGTSRPTTITVASITPSATYPTTLFDFAVGDLILIDGELLRITNIAGTTLTVDGVSGADTHSNGAIVKAYCGTGLTSNNWYSAINSFFPAWDYINDPHGEDTTGTFIWVNAYNGHMTTREHLAVTQPAFAVGTPGVNLFATTKNPAFNTSQSGNPSFAGVSTGTPGLTFQTHPTFHNISDTSPGRNYWLDIRPFVGGSSISRDTTGCDPTQPNYPASGGCAVARVSGYSNVYKVTRAGNSTSEANYPETMKYFTLYGKEGLGRMYTWVGGPGVTIGDSDHYKGCQAVVADECISGSSAGDVYVVVPSKTVDFNCEGGEVSTSNTDTCVAPEQQQASSLVRAGAIAPQRDNMYTQRLAAQSLGYYARNIAQTENAKALANGKWAVGTTVIQRQDLVLIKLPPVVTDSRNRSTWIPWQVNVVPPAGTDNVVVEFGYDTNFYCHEQRSEKCLAITATIPTGQHPYRFPVEGTGGVESGLSGVSCSSSCTVNLPLIAGRVAYYRVRYRDSGGATLRTGPTQPVVVN